jgi:hypothetical protein
MMRWGLIAVVALVGLSSEAAVAYENYITSGHAYTPQNIPLPPINSYESEFTQQTDIYEADIYVKERQRKILDSQLQRFLDGANPGIPSDDIQY